MNKLQQIKLVAFWEFMQFFKWKQELIGKGIMLAIGVFLYLWHNYDFIAEKQYQILATADTELQATSLSSPFKLVISDDTVAELKQRLLNDESIAGVLTLNSQAKSDNALILLSEGKMSWQQDLAAQLQAVYAVKVTTQLGLSEEKLALLNQPVNILNEYLDQDLKSSTDSSTFTATGLLILLGIGLFMTFAQIFVSITGEKQQRVTEQLYSCMDAQTWIDGKVIGQVLHSIKAMVSTLFTMLIAIVFTQVFLKQKSMDLSMIDFSMLPAFLVFAILGLYISTSFMAAIAAAVDDPNHSGKTSFMFIPMLPIVIGFFLMDSPSGIAMEILSYFPLTAFAIMPLKMSLIDVPIWQVIVALLSTLLACWYIRGIAGRLFKMGMIMYGKEPSIMQMLKWTLYKSN
ncbi:ABC transporter permease [Pseudoalteromonas sp. T1lg65]|uniref:ABC transporter permease n=1 Tax=Pseudoalteromonas sp. T1lg65 TaxID=2077101 RepID=UPI003F7A356A